MAAGSLPRRHPTRRVGHTVLSCEPQRRHKFICEWTLGKPNESNTSPIPVHVKERAVNTLCHPQPTCHLPSGNAAVEAHVLHALSSSKQSGKPFLPSHLPAWSSWSVCWDRLVKDSQDRLTPSTGVYHLRTEDTNHFALLSSYYLHRDPAWPDRKVLTFPTPF